MHRYAPAARRMSNPGFNKGVHVVGMSILLLGLSTIAAACDPVMPTVEDLIADTQIAVVKGRFFAAPITAQPKRAVFIINQVFRGSVGPGEYAVVEGGALGSRCEYSEMAVEYPEPDSRPGIAPTLPLGVDQYLFVSNVGKHDVLVVPIGWRYGLNETKGQIALGACRISSAYFEAALKSGPALHAPLCPMSPVE